MPDGTRVGWHQCRLAPRLRLPRVGLATALSGDVSSGTLVPASNPRPGPPVLILEFGPSTSVDARRRLGCPACHPPAPGQPASRGHGRTRDRTLTYWNRAAAGLPLFVITDAGAAPSSTPTTLAISARRVHRRRWAQAVAELRPAAGRRTG